MRKVRLFPGFQIIMHTLPQSVVFLVLAVIGIVEGNLFVAGFSLFVALAWSHGLGVVVVKPGYLASYRVTGRSLAVTPTVLAVDIDMVRRRVYAWFYANYYYPVLTLETGKVIRLPIATSSRAKAHKRAIFLRAALAVPAPGSVPIPEGRIARALSGSGRAAPAPDLVSFSPVYDIEGFNGD